MFYSSVPVWIIKGLKKLEGRSLVFSIRIMDLEFEDLKISGFLESESAEKV